MDVQKIFDEMYEKSSKTGRRIGKIYAWYGGPRNHQAYSICVDGEDHEFRTWQELADFVEQIRPKNELLHRKFDEVLK